MEFRVNSPEELEDVANQMLPRMDEGVWLFDGVMGAGKTTLIKALLRRMGSEDNVSSPTFSLVNEYRLPNGAPVFHFDFYRLEDPDEALDMGVEEYLESEALCLIEWPDRIAPYLPENCGKVTIRVEGETRVITMESPVDYS